MILETFSDNLLAAHILVPQREALGASDQAQVASSSERLVRGIRPFEVRLAVRNIFKMNGD